MGIWYNKKTAAVLEELVVDAKTGLSEEEVTVRRRRHGPNELIEHGVKSVWKILWEQLTSLMVLLLIGAALISGLALGEYEDAAVILVIVVLNALLGLHQEYKAEKAMAALKKMAGPKVRVRRDGEVREIPAKDLVPGDVLLLEAGNLVPADCRLIEAANLRIKESALTGETEPVAKDTAIIQREDPPIGDRRNIAHMGTVVTYGRGVGVVTATGMATELGRIATMIQEAEDEQTVLQRRLDHLSKVLVAAALALIGVVVLEGWLIQALPLQAIFLTAVSMAVAAIPEGLPAVVTIALALGAQRMLKRRALIRKLPAVETLGSVTVICSDKTGTLTQNRMTVTMIEMPRQQIDLPPGAEKRSTRLKKEIGDDPAVAMLIAGGTLCTDAEVKPKEGGGFETVGDPTEGALVAAARWAGLEKKALEEAFPRVDELPFESERKRMTTVHAIPAEAPGALAPLHRWLEQQHAESVAFTKGAVGSVLKVATHIWLDGKPEPLTDAWREKLMDANEEMAGDGIRVLGTAMRAFGAREDETEMLESDLIYLGMVGMLDPLREEVAQAVVTCKHAGVRAVMITGDHPLIARNIGRMLGMMGADRYLTGPELEAMDDTQLREEVKEVSVFARVSPEHKLRIVDALQQHHHIVAMTGDGVNDAPALKEADIGVAMGITGTDVSKEAADMVLQDDNFATIVAAVEEGRVIFDNIVRFVRYILASNWAEILVMLLAPLCGMPLPLIPVQILWMNLVTDGLPALALGVEPGEPDVMERKPRDPRAPIMTLPLGTHLLWVGGVMAIVALALGYIVWSGESAPLHAATVAYNAGGHGHGADITAVWQTMLFTTLVFSQLTLALAERSHKVSIFTQGLFSNSYMVGAIGIALALQLGVVYVPVLQRFFNTVALDGGQLALCLLCSTVVFIAVEVEKWVRRRRE